MRYLRSGPRRLHTQEMGVPRAKSVGLRSGEIADRNIRVILEAIRRHGPLTRTELGRHSGLTGPGITNILRRLADEKLVTSNRRNGLGGRATATEFALRPEGAFSIGVKLRRTRGEIVLIDLSGQVHDRVYFDVEPEDGVGAVHASVMDMADRHATLPIVGLGIAANDWSDARSEQLAAMSTISRTYVENECTASLLAERTIGSTMPEGGLAMIIIDDDVQAGFLIRGIPYSGVHGRAGSIGEMLTGPDNVQLNTVVGFDSLRSRIGDKDFARLLKGEEFSSPSLSQWIRDAAGHLLDPIIAMAGFIAPSVVMIGGDLPQGVIEALIHQLSVERRDTSTRPLLTPWISPMRPASFSGGGVALGAALLPFLNTLLLPPASA
ncbi:MULTISPECIES: ROK family transcriptional regulator [Rhizobium]|uniref:ROK family transcriptional regulator n=1 Tax=Rhizobium bangladeshense TaxID=1138189 RepID=A0ABS7LI74_9HYPH|nr:MULTISPECIES: ROK family transcriptional regulator [Rhizobium]MBX4867335.1 ROK family transcriptional regulator [Rhizobium bangladeshense]MBX4871626.1 ROK family transcriptional regulator [Rhizobium bangladeshense]MBX4882940.1 ROK family transcriptional regulator [Rhizobium bangladeshense]MBX4891330.1 ROK family transcriptional regulator [Rhizobium bangladeshense]MBX4915778.1 ROK family transcriptional regulator [Rhizobium bangladeshense]